MEKLNNADVIEEVKREWRSLWTERYDDRVRAEGISSGEYASLFVNRGLVIFATRDFKALNLREILSKHEVGEVDRLLGPHPSAGGWNKFIKTSILKHQRNKRSEQIRQELETRKKKQQLKKGGRGWLHVQPSFH